MRRCSNASTEVTAMARAKAREYRGFVVVAEAGWVEVDAVALEPVGLSIVGR
jgi:hypothetical protein